MRYNVVSSIQPPMQCLQNSEHSVLAGLYHGMILISCL